MKSRKQVYELDFIFNKGDYIKKEDTVYKVLDIDESYLTPVYTLEDVITHENIEVNFINLVGASKVEFKQL